MRPPWMGPDPVEVAHEKLRDHWAQMAEEKRERARVEAEMLRELWVGLSVGDGVMLSQGASREVMAAYDDEGCLIRLDGVITEIKGVSCQVRVLMESERAGTPAIGMLLWVKRDDVERCEGVHVWGRLSARWHEKRRRGEVPGESPYWVN